MQLVLKNRPFFGWSQSRAKDGSVSYRTRTTGTVKKFFFKVLH